MQRHRPWLAILSAALLAALGSCGGETVALLGFIGSAGGDWLQDDKHLRPERQRQLPHQHPARRRQPEPLLDRFRPDLHEQPARLSGQRHRTRERTASCAHRLLHRRVRHDQPGGVRRWRDTDGIWTEIQSGTRRFGFNNDTDGCELTSPTPTRVSLVVSRSDVQQPNGPFETTIPTFTIQGGGAPWQGRFVGISGLRLTRGTEVLELERRSGTANCPP